MSFLAIKKSLMVFAWNALSVVDCLQDEQRLTAVHDVDGGVFFYGRHQTSSTSGWGFARKLCHMFTKERSPQHRFMETRIRPQSVTQFIQWLQRWRFSGPTIKGFAPHLVITCDNLDLLGGGWGPLHLCFLGMILALAN